MSLVKALAEKRQPVSKESCQKRWQKSFAKTRRKRADKKAKVASSIPA